MEKIDYDLERYIFNELDITVKLDPKKRQQLIDNRTDKIAKMLALYPTTPTKTLVNMFGFAYETIKQIADHAGVKKIERRGGHNRKKVELINIEGYIIKVYDSLADFARYNNMKEHTLQNKLSHGGGRLQPGIFMRYRK